ncbi:DUF559 domain-containing protein [Asticcacaulis sp.]|uniref:endonuclease domain-containing protein n=1 Tax=Asticcacaulis sp. TaxID=1872648 RepID=UPI0031D26DB7
MNDAVKRKTASARQMRKALTTPEWLLWEHLNHRTDGLIFKRQFAIGPYILYFYCFKARLAVEVDGTLHSLDDRAKKTRRAMRGYPCRALRFAAWPPLICAGMLTASRMG